MFEALKKKLAFFTSKLKERAETAEAGPKKKPDKTSEAEKPKEEAVETSSEAYSKSPGAAEAGEYSKSETEERAEEGIETGAKEIEKSKKADFEELLKETASEEDVELERPKIEKRELKAKISLKSAFAGIVTGSIRIEEKDLKNLIYELELSLLEADVEQETAGEICREIEKELVGKNIPKRDFDSFIKKSIKETLSKVMQSEKIDLLERISKKQPYVILFLGPNGAGKTTTIAKIAHLLQKKGKKVILAAADTFRAASIEQLETHAERLGTRVVKHQYGADPAAVAFDAVKAAQAKNIDVVLIDSAGRQDTNKNLMRELEKICRVVKPDLKIFVGEALSGQSLLNQASEFDKVLGLDGFILTKIDADAKGGTTISLIYRLKKPVIYIGTGQGYENLLEFSPSYIIERVV